MRIDLDLMFSNWRAILVSNILGKSEMIWRTSTDPKTGLKWPLSDNYQLEENSKTLTIAILVSEGKLLEIVDDFNGLELMSDVDGTQAA